MVTPLMANSGHLLIRRNSENSYRSTQLTKVASVNAVKTKQKKIPHIDKRLFKTCSAKRYE
jgi:hypothetical protein